MVAVRELHSRQPLANSRQVVSLYLLWNSIADKEALHRAHRREATAIVDDWKKYTRLPSW